MRLIPDLFLTFAKIGAFTFGGGYAMLSLLESECVEKKGWITSEEFSDVVVIAESTPGPIAINCATYTGYRQAGFKGAVAATLGMVMPSFLIILLISLFFEDLFVFPVVENIFKGIRVAVALLVIRAVWSMVQKMLKKTPNKKHSIAFAAVAFVIVLATNLMNIRLSTVWLILVSAVIGLSLYGLPLNDRRAKK